MLSEEFARAHKLQPGDKLGATINGRRKKLTIVGLTLSPEYIYQIAPGAMFLDYVRYGVLWMARQPLTTLGIAMACSIMMVSGFQEAAINYMVEVQFGMSQREDLMAIYTEPTSERSLYSLRSLQGVEYVEGFRDVPARLRFEHHSYRTAVNGVEPDGSLLGLPPFSNQVPKYLQNPCC